MSKLDNFEMFEKRYEEFVGGISENDGFGNEKFFFAKNGDSSNYFFKIEDNDKHDAFVVTIGKFSQFATPTENKSDYGVISITKLDEKALDQAVMDKGTFEQNSVPVDIDQELCKKILTVIADCIGDYLQKNPKVNKFYDELQAKVKCDGFNELFKDSIMEWPGGYEAWHFQEVESGKLNLVNK